MWLCLGGSQVFLFVSFVLLLLAELNDNSIKRENCGYLEKQIFLVEEYQ